MEMTPRLGMPLLVAGQVQKEVFHNEALSLADLLIGGVVESGSFAGPPAVPVVGRLYRVAPTNASGAFSGYEASLAGYGDGGWRFISPVEGMRFSEPATGVEIAYRGGAWITGSIRALEIVIDGKKVVGARLPAIVSPVGGGVIDSEGRAIINQILTMMRTHGLVEP